MKNIIGLDIGGTKITGVVLDGKKIVKELTIVTPKDLFNFEKSLLKLVDFLSAGLAIHGLGAGMAGYIDRRLGLVKHSPNIKFISNFNLKKFFKLNGFKNVEIENDARCFALAEARVGQGKKAKNSVCVTLGTGIGGGLVANGQLYHGINFGAGEVGHMVYDGKKTFEEVFQAARDKKDNKALAEIVGALLTNIYRVVDPGSIVLGGGVAQDKTRNFVKGAKQVCVKFLAEYKIKPNIAISKLKNAGALGAALLIK